ncbi:MAG: NTP transferase domain-containing protein [Candidatus Methylomirabilales bacterium]
MTEPSRVPLGGVAVPEGYETGTPKPHAVGKAVIIAAGRGGRLQEPGRQHWPKPLVRAGGLSLLERTILTIKEAGVTEFLVVIGYRGPEIRQWITARNLGVAIEWVENPEWEKQNGLSVLAAEGYLEGPFLLSMSDHLFSDETVRRLIHAPIADGEVILAVDRKIRAVPDLDDATKVLLRDHHVAAIGKNLADYNAIDTGLFLCTPALFAALRWCQMHTECSLSDGIGHLAAQRQVRTLDIGGDFWLDVDTPDALRLAEKSLFQKLTKPQDGFLAKRLNRPISLRVTRFLADTSVTPNQITGALFVVGIVAAVLFAQGGTVSMIGGALLFQAQSTLDGCDGEIARLKFQTSRLGGILDVVGDGLVTAAGFFGIGLGVSRQSGQPLPLLLGAVAAGGALACMGVLFLLVHQSGGFSGSFRSFSPFQDSHATRSGLPARLLGHLTRVLDGLSRRDYTYLVLLLALVGRLSWFLWMVSVGISVYLLGLVVLYGASFFYERV